MCDKKIIDTHFEKNQKSMTTVKIWAFRKGAIFTYFEIF